MSNPEGADEDVIVLSPNEDGCVVVVLRPTGFEILFPGNTPVGSDITFDSPVGQASIIAVLLGEPEMLRIRKLIWNRLKRMADPSELN